MFKNRSFNVKMVKDEKGNDVRDPNFNPFEQVEVAAAYAEVAKDFITHTAMTVGGAFMLYKIVERICR